MNKNLNRTAFLFFSKMKEKELVDYFENYLKRKPLFKNKECLQPNFTPSKITHREQQIERIAQILAPALRKEKPSNLFIYGKTGTGKTLVVKHIISKLQQVADKTNTPLKIIYLNCKLKKLADTEYRLIAQVLREYGKEIPITGLPTDEVYHNFFSTLDKSKHTLILVLDEIDQLVGKVGDDLLYNLTRINSELKESKVTIVGISNDLVFTETLDPRVKSSLSEEEIIFPPYNALQIQDILQDRANEAFSEGVLEEGLIEKCAAYAAREHGDARRAIELLRIAAELAERENSPIVKIEHLDRAEKKLEHDRIIDVVTTQPKHYQATLAAILTTCTTNKTRLQPVYTGEIYAEYEQVCNAAGLRPLTQRRVSDIIAELDMLGIISAKVISKGRYGRTREISLSIPTQTIEKIKSILCEEFGWNQWIQKKEK